MIHAAAAGFAREEFSAGVTVFRAGDSGESAYVIEEGCVEVLVGSGAAEERIDILSPGDMFGEVALLDHLPRTATLRTLVPTVLMRIDRVHVEQLLQRSDPVIQYIVRLLLERFRNKRAALVQSLDGSPMGRKEAEPDAPAQDVHAAALRTLSLARDLSDAIAGNQLELHYQPIFLCQGVQLAGFEALVRWRHPTLGVVSPDEFIPLAERTGLIHAVGAWVLQRALSDWQPLRALCSQGLDLPPFLSVNLSAPELCGPNIVQQVHTSLLEHGMPADQLRIELTETTVIQSVEAVSRATQQLRAMGVGIALDDFGTGYAGLGYLQALPFSSLKIDRSFVGKMCSSERSFQIIKSALELSSLLGLSTVAEGIEDQAVGQLLTEMGCTYAQGYHYARPMPLAQLQAWRLTAPKP